MKINDWVLFPLTKDDIDNPTMVAKIVGLDGIIVNVAINATDVIPVPKKWCKVVYIQNLPSEI